jgi:hypothetical protein
MTTKAQTVSKDSTTEGMRDVAHHGDSKSRSLKYDQRLPVVATQLNTRNFGIANTKSMIVMYLSYQSTDNRC